MALAGSSKTDLGENQEKIDYPELMQLINENKLKNNRYWDWTGQPNNKISIFLDKLHGKYVSTCVSTLEVKNLLGKLVPYLCKAPCSSLTVDCSSVNLLGEYLDAILVALKDTAVRSLEIKSANLGLMQADLLRTAFSKLKHTKIEELNLYGKDLANNVDSLLSALVDSNVRELNLSFNYLHLVQADLLRTAFSKLKDTKIEKLALCDNKLANNIDPLLSALVGNTTVRELDLSLNDLHLVQADLLRTAFSKLKDTKIEKLILCENGLANNIDPLFSALVDSDVRELNLEMNDLGLVQADLLGTAFSKLKHTKIEKLGLDDNELANNVTVLLPALVDNTAIRHIDLCNNNLDTVELKTLCEAFSSLQHTAVDSLSFRERFRTVGFGSWDLNSMEKLLAKLSGTKIRKVSCYGPEGSGNLVNWFNSNIAYPHDTVYHESGLQRACIRTMMQNNLDLNAARSNIQLEKIINEYESDELGLEIGSIYDEEDTTDEDIGNSDEEDTTDEDIGNSDEEDTTNEDMEIPTKRSKLL
ncbi:hypothetical protein [Candidatus Cardinium hertigii]|uniref:Leucine-rich repeat domain-containing protein n=1 Tax=Candidatus Cardinium hertigii TaxID=247481 RepID=A0A3N2QCN3_9BACT|nr:hypothetical protein [Candidatus Cardinium hertigii]ROT47439.1 hypothetical protein EDM02_02160 [Candidatus Cardinium hertigii]ROT47443.1 hypothetical protein EDM02_02180 [Candidatus Cardinium hertigii]